jgi:GLPGLI family protein
MHDSIIIGSVDPANNPSPQSMLTTAEKLDKLPKARVDIVIRKNFRQQDMLVIANVLNDPYAYKEPMPLMQWNIDDEKVQIGSFECQHATTVFRGRKYNAYFSASFPFSDGHYKFSGLPGLIVKIADEKNEIEWSLVGFSKTNKLVTWMEFFQPKMQSRKVIHELKKKYFLDPFAMAEMGGKQVRMDEETKWYC